MPSFTPALHLGHRQIGVIAVGAAAALGLACYAFLRKKPDPTEIERQRREFLAQYGRITDATLIDSSLSETDAGNSRPYSVEIGGDLGEEPVASVLLYQYRVSGVQYESAQDVSLLAEYVRHVRVDLPVQVRYDPHNPSNSIVVAESWSGLRLEP